MAPKLSARIATLVKSAGGTREAAEWLGVSQRTVQRAVKAANEGREFLKDNSRKETYNQLIPIARDRGMAVKELAKLEGKRLPKETGLDPVELRQIRKDVLSGKLDPKEVLQKAKAAAKVEKEEHKTVERGVLIYKNHDEFIQIFGGTEPYIAKRFSSKKEAVKWTKSFGAGPQYFVVAKMPSINGKPGGWSVYDVRGPNYHTMPAGDKEEVSGLVLDEKMQEGYSPSEEGE